MKNLLVPKSNRLLIQFKASAQSPKLTKRIESFRTTSVEKAQSIINKRNKDNILFASFGSTFGFHKTDKNLQLSKFERI